jgi:hypothetical protein
MSTVHGVEGVGIQVVVSSNLSCDEDPVEAKAKKKSTPAGFEPALPKGNRFLIYRRNHLAMMSDITTRSTMDLLFYLNFFTIN